MNIPKYWARGHAEFQGRRGRVKIFECWGWSSQSMAEAETMAQERSDRVAKRMNEGIEPERYGYADRPLHEEILEEMDAPPEAACVITRNSYGCRVMNTAGAMFVDVDFPEDALRSRRGSILGRLFGRKEPVPDPLEDLQKEALEVLADAVENMPGSGARIYRTAAGLRYLFTHDLFDASSDDISEIMFGLRADPLYVRLCRAQQCFRARLTPKPWRCNLSKPPRQHPRDDTEREAVRRWALRYEEGIRPYATCSFVAHIGESRTHPAIQSVVAMHDKETRMESGLPLA